jgi:hypothetical protein
MIEGHTHDFAEVMYDDASGTELRCRCGARLWEPPATKIVEVLSFKNGSIFKEGGRLVFRRRADT